MKIPNAMDLQYGKSHTRLIDDTIYIPVLNKCVEKILTTSKTTMKTFVIFQVPMMLIGVSKYKLNECVLFLMKSLTNNNYSVDFIDPCYLMIDWCKKKHTSKISKEINKILKNEPNLKIEFEQI